MISMSFVRTTENTEKKAKKFFEDNVRYLFHPDDFIEKAADDGYADDNEIDWDLFKHLMKKYHYTGY